MVYYNEGIQVSVSQGQRCVQQSPQSSGLELFVVFQWSHRQSCFPATLYDNMDRRLPNQGGTLEQLCPLFKFCYLCITDCDMSSLYFQPIQRASCYFVTQYSCPKSYYCGQLALKFLLLNYPV